MTVAADLLRDLGLRGIVHHCHVFNEFAALARTLAYPDHMLNGKKFLDEGQIKELARRHGLSSWTVMGGIYGTKKQCKAYKSELKKCLSSLGLLVFIDDTARRFLRLVNEGRGKSGMKSLVHRGLWSLIIRSPLSHEMIKALLDVYPLLKGEPNESILPLAYFKNKQKQPLENLDPVRDYCGFIWFSPMIPASGK